MERGWRGEEMDRDWRGKEMERGWSLHGGAWKWRGDGGDGEDSRSGYGRGRPTPLGCFTSLRQCLVERGFSHGALQGCRDSRLRMIPAQKEDYSVLTHGW
jgi:hypothetical protein